MKLLAVVGSIRFFSTAAQAEGGVSIESRSLRWPALRSKSPLLHDPVLSARAVWLRYHCRP
jgi:hypothetical protein